MWGWELTLVGGGVWLGEADLVLLGPHDLCRVTRRSRIPAPQDQETSGKEHLVTRGSEASLGHCSRGRLRPRSVGPVSSPAVPAWTAASAKRSRKRCLEWCPDQDGNT